MLAQGVHVWSCARQPGEGTSCASNSCPVIASYSVNPRRATVGERIELRATTRDDDADDVTLHWTTTLGGFVNPFVGNTSYTCTQEGSVKLTLVAADQGCETSMNVDVECM